MYLVSYLPVTTWCSAVIREPKPVYCPDPVKLGGGSSPGCTERRANTPPPLVALVSACKDMRDKGDTRLPTVGSSIGDRAFGSSSGDQIEDRTETLPAR